MATARGPSIHSVLRGTFLPRVRIIDVFTDHKRIAGLVLSSGWGKCGLTLSAGAAIIAMKLREVAPGAQGSKNPNKGPFASASTSCKQNFRQELLGELSQVAGLKPEHVRAIHDCIPLLNIDVHTVGLN